MQDFDAVNYGNRLGNNKMLMTLVAKEFLKESAGLVEQLLAHVAAEDWTNVARVAHRIKGASAEVSGLAMSDTAKRIESAAQADDATTVQQALEQLQKEYKALTAALSSSEF
ncbi:Hpt domain-containing protein [Marinomonas sp.]|uniref:Hpt domain-containing protein n=1 Tax=Marinomonas sp. TaxID=1904862 RepID=UPI003F9B8BFD